MPDTNVVSELARNPRGIVARRIGEVGPDAICVSIITAPELRYGCAKKGSAKLLAQIEAILRQRAGARTGRAADAEYGVIRAELEAAGKPIGANGMLMPPMRLPSELFW